MNFPTAVEKEAIISLHKTCNLTKRKRIHFATEVTEMSLEFDGQIQGLGKKRESKKKYFHIFIYLPTMKK